MPKKRKDEDSIFLRGLLPYKDFIAAMEQKHKVIPVELGRALFAAAAAFYEKHGFFSFPVRIEPEAFQAKWVEEQQAKYEHGPSKGGADPRGKPPDKSQRHRGDGPRRAVS